MSGAGERPVATRSSGVLERRVETRGGAARVLEKGSGAPLGVLAGIHGFPRWNAFLEALAARRRVVVPSLPGFPGGAAFRELDELLDWIVATQELLEASGLAGADLVGLGPGAMLAAETAALSPASVGRLALVAPLGLFDEAEPVADFWALRASEVPAEFSARPADFAASLAAPPDADEAEWQIEAVRALEACGRLLWPTCDRGLARRLHRIRSETLLVWGAEDRVVPAGYAKRFAAGIAAPTVIRSIPAAGHRVDFDAPEALAEVVLSFLG